MEIFTKNKARIDSELSTKITKEKILENIDADFIDIEEEKMDLNFHESHERFNKDRTHQNVLQRMEM